MQEIIIIEKLHYRHLTFPIPRARYGGIDKIKEELQKVYFLLDHFGQRMPDIFKTQKSKTFLRSYWFLSVYSLSLHKQFFSFNVFRQKKHKYLYFIFRTIPLNSTKVIFAIQQKMEVKNVSEMRNILMHCSWKNWKILIWNIIYIKYCLIPRFQELVWNII